MTAWWSCLIALPFAAFGQTAAFEAADVHAVTVNLSNFNIFMKGPTARAGRYEIRTATMADLISHAYGVDQDKVLGGPSWLEMDRFDVVAKLPAGSTPESQKLMLQSLLADRFKLVVHNDTKPMPAYALTASKHPQLKEADGGGDKGCKFDFQGMPNGPQAAPAEGPQPIPTVLYTCRNVTMAAFAEDMRRGIVSNFIHDKPILDQTNLPGSFDFNFKFTLRGMPGVANASDNVTVFDALDKQLGLKLEMTKAPLPVIVVDSVNRKPTDNAPDIAKILPGSAAPTEFDVADIKPTPSDFMGARFQIQPGGRVNLQGVTLQMVVGQAWNMSDDMIVGAPKWLDEDRFDIVAKAPSAALSGGGPNGPNIDFDSVMTMVKSLLVERFKFASHMEEKTISAYTLLAVKPKMKPADPHGRIKCEEGPGADAKDPRDSNPVLGRLITCQNMSMARFAEMLQGLAPGYIHAPVLDSTGLDGTFDFTLSFSTAGQLQSGPGRRAGESQAQASDPNGALSLLDALPKQLGLKLELTKRPVEVLVIDHVEQKPTDN
jgi:uncharacterized protein (TIGR03435 family)